MKEAYVSVVHSSKNNCVSMEELHELDKNLRKSTRNHEILIICPFPSESKETSNNFEFSGPISFVYTSPNSSKNAALVAGLARSVGDFIIEWAGPIDELNVQMISDLLEPTDHGVELIELEFAETSLSSKIFYKLANSLRPSSMPVRKTFARSYSRRALNQVLNAISFEPQLNILFAELPIQRLVLKSKIYRSEIDSYRIRFIEGMNMLVKGSRFGTVIPLSLAAISVLFSLSVSVYATVLYFLVGKSPEGWTTLMIVTGLGQASILGLLGLTWSRIDSLARGMSRHSDATAHVVVIPPKV